MVDGSAAVEDSPYVDPVRKGLQPAREHRVFIIVFVLSAMLCALALTYIYSERYRAEVTIFFKPTDVTLLNNHTTEALGSPVPSPTLRHVTQTINGLIDSDVMLRRVVTDLHLELEEPRDLSGPWHVHRLKELKYTLTDYASDAWMLLRFGRILKGDPVADAIARLRRALKMLNEDSYVYTLQVVEKTPQRAAAVADDVGTALIDLLHRDDRLWSDKRGAELSALKDAKDREIERIEAEMRDLLANNQVASITDELEKITDRASRLRQQQSDAMADLRQSEAKVAAQADKLRLASPLAPARDDDTAATRRLSRINADDYARMTSNKLDAEVNSASLRARLDSLDRSYAVLLPRLQLLTRVRAEYDLLSAQLKSATRDYAAVTDAIQELAIRMPGGQNELHMQAKAIAPAVPVSPIKIYHVGAAGLLALLIASGLAYVFDYFDIRLFLPPPDGRRRGRERLPVLASEPGGARVTGD